MSEFLDMGGYGQYVWSSYGAFALVIGALVIWTWRRSAAVQRELREVESQTGKGGAR